MSLEQQQYEEELARKQQEHMDRVEMRRPWKPCLHDSCIRCFGTGEKEDGTACFHEFSCDCPKCSQTLIEI